MHANSQILHKLVQCPNVNSQYAFPFLNDSRTTVKWISAGPDYAPETYCESPLQAATLCPYVEWLLVTGTAQEQAGERQ